MIPHLFRLFDHVTWADGVLFNALESTASPPAEAVREYAHILGADEVWLSRLEGRPARTPVWPTMDLAGIRALAAEVHAGFRRYLEGLSAAKLTERVAYTNSAGQSFETPVDEILLHVALHAQYHRGKVNLLLRQAGLTPAPTDFIAFVRGAPAATTRRTG